MGFKYHENIFNAITTVLADPEAMDEGLSSNKLYVSSRQLIDITKKDHARCTIKLSKNLFYFHLDRLLLDQEIVRSEIVTSTLKLKTVNYCLTEKGRKRRALRISKITIGTREKAYALLFLYGSTSAPVLPTENDMNILECDEKLERFLLNEFNLNPDVFKVDNVRYNSDKYRVTEMVRINPHPDIRYVKVEYLKGSGMLNGRYEFRYKLPGVTVRCFLHGVRTGLPLQYILDLLTLTEIQGYVKQLLDEHLMEEVLIFHGESRFDIVNEKWKQFILGCFILEGIVESTMIFIWKNARPPKEDERFWHEMWRGPNFSMSFISECYSALKRIPQDSHGEKGYHKLSVEMEGTIKNWGYKGAKLQYDKLVEEYKEILSDERYSIPSQFILEMVYPKFFQHLIRENRI